MGILNLKLKREVLILIIFVFLGAIIGIFFYRTLLSNAKEQIKKTTDKLNIAEGELRRRKMMLAEIGKFKGMQLEIESKTLKFKELVPHTVDTTKILKLLEDLSSEFKFKEMKVDILPLTEIEGSYFARCVRVYFQGRYLDIAKFFNAVQNFQYLLNLEELEIRRNPHIVPFLEVTCLISTIQCSAHE